MHEYEAVSIAVCDVLLRHHFHNLSTRKLHHEPKVFRMDFRRHLYRFLLGDVGNNGCLLTVLN